MSDPVKAERARLLGHVPDLIRWDGLTQQERTYLIRIRAAHKKGVDAYEPKPWQMQMMQRLVAAWMREMMG